VELWGAFGPWGRAAGLFWGLWALSFGGTLVRSIAPEMVQAQFAACRGLPLPPRPLLLLLRRPSQKDAFHAAGRPGSVQLGFTGRDKLEDTLTHFTPSPGI
jgi:hypothetical protein